MTCTSGRHFLRYYLFSIPPVLSQHHHHISDFKTNQRSLQALFSSTENVKYKVSHTLLKIIAESIALKSRKPWICKGQILREIQEHCFDSQQSQIHF